MATRSTTRSSSDTKYARLEEKVGWRDEYSGSPAGHYHIGHCDTCNIHDQLFGERAYGEDKERYRGTGAQWVTAHNQKYHQAQARPNVVGAPAQLQSQLVCGHTYGDDDEPCGQALALYTGNWEFDRPMYVCGFRHWVEVPEKVDPAQSRAATRAINAGLADTHEQHEIDQQLITLQKRRKKPARPSSRKQI